jgi:ribosomal protein L14
MYKHSRFRLIDNTGVKIVKILQVYNHRQVVPGDIVLTTIKKKKKNKKSVKKKVNNCYIISTNARYYRNRGAYFLHLTRKKGILLGNDNEKYLGSRHKGFLTIESKKTAFVQLLRSCRVVV